jgi:H+-transporting ATPase
LIKRLVPDSLFVHHVVRCRTLTSLQITLTAGDLYDKDKVDIEHVVMEEVFQLLQCDDKGLTTAEVQNRLGIFGPNKLEEKKEK